MAQAQTMNVFPIALIGIVAAILAFDKRYEDGLIRHASLGAMIVAAVVIVGSVWWADHEYEFPFEVRLFHWAFAVFFICHAISFIRWRLTGMGTWGKKKDDNSS